MLTAERIAANRLNAQKSTGPQTPEGKARSRCNALKHGLTSSTVLPPDDQEEFDQRLADWNDQLEPQNPVEAFLVRTAVLSSVKLDRCARADFAHVTAARRATIDSWQEEQHARLLQVLRQASEDPSRAIAQLEEFAIGCDWLIDAWNALAEALDATGTWTADQLAEAHHLLGLHADDAHSPDPRIAVVSSYLTGPDRRLFVQAQLDRLEALREQLWSTQDGPALAEAINIAVVDTSPAGSLRHRYQLASFQQFFRALRSFEQRRPTADHKEESNSSLRSLTRLIGPRPAAQQAQPAERNEPRPQQTVEASEVCAGDSAAERNEPSPVRSPVPLRRPLSPVASRRSGPQPPRRSTETAPKAV